MITVVILCYRSERMIEKVVAAVREELKSHGYSYQIILVNDGSPDDTMGKIRSLCAQDDHIVGIDLSRNFGQQNARMASLPFIRGDYVVFMDDDGQHPANGIIPLITKLDDGYDIVYAAFTKKQHSRMKQAGSRINAWMTTKLVGKPKDIMTSSFFAIRPFVARELMQYHSPFPYPMGYLMRITQKIANQDIEHQPRMSGRSGYSFRKMIKLWLDGFTSFSILPLRIASFAGMLTSIIGVLMGVFAVVRRIINPGVPSGYTSLIAVLLFTTGLIMFMLGLLGEYIGRIFMTINNLPQYIVSEKINAE